MVGGSSSGVRASQPWGEAAPISTFCLLLHTAHLSASCRYSGTTLTAAAVPAHAYPHPQLFGWHRPCVAGAASAARRLSHLMRQLGLHPHATGECTCSGE